MPAVIENGNGRITRNRTEEHYQDYSYTYWVLHPYLTHKLFEKFDRNESKEAAMTEANRIAKLFEKKITEITVIFKEGESITLPSALQNIANEIEHSKYILALHPGWDGESALSISKNTYFASIKFLQLYSSYIYDHYQIIIKAPEVNPCSDGSVDLSWRTDNARMLINVKSKGDVLLAFYYGDLYQNNSPIKGNTPIDSFSEALAVWMKQLR